jgi:hypothetical protein
VLPPHAGDDGLMNRRFRPHLFDLLRSAGPTTAGRSPRTIAHSPPKYQGNLTTALEIASAGKIFR